MKGKNMSKKLAMIHTVIGIAQSLETLANRLMPKVEIIHIVNEAILKNLMKKAALDAETVRSVSALATEAQRAGADAILITCSSISPCAEVARKLVSIPVFKIDEPMAVGAVRRWKKIGVAATVKTTLAPTVDLIRQKAKKKNKKISIKPVLCKGAFEALMKSDAKRHDEIVRAELLKLSKKVEGIVFAQASMARVADAISGLKVPVLSSPVSGLKQVKKHWGIK